MESNIRHHSQCVPSQNRKKSKSPIKRDVKVLHQEGANEKMLVLRDENHSLKSKGRELEEEVKL